MEWVKYKYILQTNRNTVSSSPQWKFPYIEDRSLIYGIRTFLIYSGPSSLGVAKLRGMGGWTLPLTHCGPVTSYGNIDLGQHWLRQWLVAWRHQAITWAIDDLSAVRSCDIHVRSFSYEDLMTPIRKSRLLIAFLKLHQDVTGTNELMAWNPLTRGSYRSSIISSIPSTTKWTKILTRKNNIYNHINLSMFSRKEKYIHIWLYKSISDSHWFTENICNVLSS